MSKVNTSHTIQVGSHTTFDLEFENERGEIDTRVIFDDDIWISGEQKSEFINDLEQLLQKYFI